MLHSKGSCRSRLLFLHLFVALTGVCSSACGGGGGSTQPGSGGDTTPPSVVSTTPSNGATGVSVNSLLSATFSEPMSAATIDETSFTLSGNMMGTVSYSGLTATFAPDGDLDYSTIYNATISALVADTSGNPMGTSFTWSFTTEDAPQPVFSLPFEPGKRWLYDETRNATVICCGGISQSTFVGQTVVHVEDDMHWEGRSAWRVLVYKLEDYPPETSSPFRTEVVYLSEEPDGLHKWTNSGWKRVLSIFVPSFGGNSFFLAGSPRGPTTTISQALIQVPAGMFNAVRANVLFTQGGGPFDPVDISENRSEYYADGVGLVRANWNFSEDDNDPQGIDEFTDGIIQLRYIDNGPFPDITAESEPNDSALLVQKIGNYSIVSGSVDIDDAGHESQDPNVFENEDGVKVLQDWYRFSTGSTQLTRLDLRYDNTTSPTPDLDVYLFGITNFGSLFFVDRGILGSGAPEAIDLTSLNANSNYYIAVQAWSTPNGSVEYWFTVR